MEKNKLLEPKINQHGCLQCPYCSVSMQPTRTGNMKQHIEFKHGNGYPKFYNRTKK